MEVFAIVAFWAVLVIAWNGKDWIAAHWSGKTEANREERLTAEARAKEAEAKLALAKINGTSPATHP